MPSLWKFLDPDNIANMWGGGPTPAIYGHPPKFDPFYHKFGLRSHDIFGAFHKICNPRYCSPSGVLQHDSHCFLRSFSTFCAANFHGNMAASPGTLSLP